MASMERPIFSLATKPDRRVFRYEHNGNKHEIVPSVKVLATIHDKDILIYCISQLIGKMNQGERPSRTLPLTARDLQIGRAHVRTPVTNAHLLCRLLLGKKKNTTTHAP